MRRQGPLRFRSLSRDAVLFGFGLAGIFYETVFDNADRPTLLILFGAMVGLPAFLRLDQSHQPESSKSEPPPVLPVES